LRLLDAVVPATHVPDALAVFEIHGLSKTGSVDLSEFYREEATALLKIGRRLAAAAGLGRAAAAAALTADGRVDSGRLPEAIGRFERMAIDWGLAAESRVVRPAGYAEAARLELQVTPRGIRHLARPAPWLSRTSRRMILRAAGRAPVVIGRRIVRGLEQRTSA
jgi:hypothetical protein